MKYDSSSTIGQGLNAKRNHYSYHYATPYWFRIMQGLYMDGFIGKSHKMLLFFRHAWTRHSHYLTTNAVYYIILVPYYNEESEVNFTLSAFIHHLNNPAQNIKNMDPLHWRAGNRAFTILFLQASTAT